MNKIAASMTLLLLTTSFCVAQTKTWNASELDTPIPSEQWQVMDVAFQVTKPIVNPLKRDVFAVVTGKDGEQKVPLFYNGKQQWVFRYSSSTVGEKTFVLQSDIKELDGQRGKLTITKNTKADRHGGIVLNKKTPNRFFYEDGTHYFNLAFSIVHSKLRV